MMNTITVIVVAKGWINRHDADPPRFRKTLFTKRCRGEVE